MLVGLVDLYVGRYADRHIGQFEKWVWDWNGSVAPKLNVSHSDVLFIKKIQHYNLIFLQILSDNVLY